MKEQKLDIYVLHQYGAPSHFYGLDEYAKLKGYKIKYRELNQIPAIKKLFLSFDLKVFVNIWFLFCFPFLSKSKVVLAVAPYNRWVPLLMRLLKKHDVYFFTSYSCWDQSVAHHPINGNEKLLLNWKKLTNTFVKHNFVVTETTKNELINNGFSSSDNISVVYHSYRDKIIPAKKLTKKLDFIQVARLIPEKGVEQIIEVFKKYPECSITFVGSGILKNVVIDASKKYNNIKYAGYISNFQELVSLYKSNSFLLLNSQHLPGSTWEEYFGIALIEGMACGVVPISADHTGPKEIIENDISGILYKAEDLERIIQRVIEMSDTEYINIYNQSIKRAQMFHSSSIASKWSAVDL